MPDGTGFLDFGHELVVDLFAGGGGASAGMSRAYREPDVAINHNPVAIGVHEANHPNTQHYVSDVFEVDPVEATGGRPVAVLWASPDCRHHSKAKGGKPRSKKIRALAWVVVKWAAAVKPRLIHLENVEEFAGWGPLLKDGSPCKARKGHTFRRWMRELEKLGYQVEHKELVAADYGAPTIRKRLYVIARCDGRPIVWPKPTHHKTGAGGLPRWRTAAECIDWAIPAKSIFGRKKDLAKNTRRRVARGLWRYVLNTSYPFIVKDVFVRPDSARWDGTAPVIAGVGGRAGQSEPRSVNAAYHTTTAKADTALVCAHLTEFANASTQRNFGADEPLRTQCAQIKGGHFALVSGTLVQIGYGERKGQAPRSLDPFAPLGTVVAGGVKHAAVGAHLIHLTHHGERAGYGADEPARTVTAAHRGEQALVSACLEQANGGFYDGDGRAATDPISTICASGANQRLVTAYLVKYYGEGGQWQAANEPMHTVPTKDRMGLVRAVHLPADALTDEQLAGARRVAAFLHEELPEHFPELMDAVLVGDYVMVDITLRMLVPRELARAQGFPDSYVIERTATGKPVIKTDQVRLVGNSVCPDVAEVLLRANAADLINFYRSQAA